MSSQYGATTISATASVLLNANNARRGFVIANNGAVTIYVGLDATVSSSTGIQLLSQDRFDENGQDCYRGAMWAVTSTGSSDIRFWEWEG